MTTLFKIFAAAIAIGLGSATPAISQANTVDGSVEKIDQAQNKMTIKQLDGIMSQSGVRP